MLNYRSNFDPERINREIKEKAMESLKATMREKLTFPGSDKLTIEFSPTIDGEMKMKLSGPEEIVAEAKRILAKNEE